jgi:hypothetical protein
MRNILLLINNDIAAVQELARVADLIGRTSDLRPVVFIEQSVYWRQHLGVPAMFAERGIEVLTSNSFSGDNGHAALGKQGRAMRRWRAKFVSEALPALARLVPSSHQMITALKSYRETIDGVRDAMLRRAAICDAVLSERPYSAVVISEDNVELDTGVWTAIARRHGVRSIIVPYTMSNAAEFAESFVHHPSFRVHAAYQNYLVARLFPEWTLRYKGCHFLRSTCAKVIAVELLGLTPPDPWVMNSGYADAIAVESIAMHDYCLAAGLPARQLVTTGSLTDDIIAAVLDDIPQRRSTLVEEFGLQDDRPILLCALPPDQNTYNRPGCEFADFDELVRFWGECLSQVGGWNVIVRPHPKTAPECLDALRQCGINITYNETATLVPLCDLYVVSVSSTIRWAIACGKPVINYDAYQFGYNDFHGLQGVALANTRNEFRDLVRQLTTDRNRRAALAAAQQRDSGRWGRLDGMSGRRMLALLRGETLTDSLPLPHHTLAKTARSQAAMC